MKGNTNKKRFYFRNLLSFARVGWTWDLICSSTESVKTVSSSTETRTSTQLVGEISQVLNAWLGCLTLAATGVTATPRPTFNTACWCFSLMIRLRKLSWSFRVINYSSTTTVVYRREKFRNNIALLDQGPNTLIILKHYINY